MAGYLSQLKRELDGDIAMAIKDNDSAQVAHSLLNLKDGGQNGEFDEELQRRYGITFENFHKLICDLAPLCDAFWTKASGQVVGFRDETGWLAKVTTD